MSDQYTRITTGGSPLDKHAPVVGLLFGVEEDRPAAVAPGSAEAVNGPTTVLQIKDADDIPVEVSDASNLQVDLHKAVFPQHRVVGWYRATSGSQEPTGHDLEITQKIKAHYAPADSFCFCLLQVQSDSTDDTKMKSSDDDGQNDTLGKDLPINLYELHMVDGTTPILLSLSNWQLETSEAERIAVERVMKERPSEVDDSSPSHNPYMVETKGLQHSLASMKDRVKVIVACLEDMEHGKIPTDPSLLRQIQGLVSSLGPLATMSETANDGQEEGVVLLAHLAIVSRTVSAVQSYTDKFRVLHESRSTSKEMRRIAF